MTEISFHFNAPDKMAHICRLLRKAANAGHRVSVVGEKAFLQQLDTALWTFSALDFIPHCFSDAAPSVQVNSAVVLSTGAQTGGPGVATQILVNLTNEVPPGFERFERVIELVGLEDEDRQAARLRWKHYATRGYAIARHDLGAASA